RSVGQSIKRQLQSHRSTRRGRLRKYSTKWCESYQQGGVADICLPQWRAKSARTPEPIRASRSDQQRVVLNVQRCTQRAFHPLASHKPKGPAEMQDARTNKAKLWFEGRHQEGRLAKMRRGRSAHAERSSAP